MSKHGELAQEVSDRFDELFLWALENNALTADPKKGLVMTMSELFSATDIIRGKTMSKHGGHPKPKPRPKPRPK